jgi:diadenosine tetraphosphate (Ap4A) HIT family hydrolase
VKPLQVVSTLSDLRKDEAEDLWRTTKLVVEKLEVFYQCSAYTIEVKDGWHPTAWLTINVIPRHSGDLRENDVIYHLLEREISIPEADISALAMVAKKIRQIV